MTRERIFFLSQCILSRVVCSHASRAIPASLSPAQQAPFHTFDLSISRISSWRCPAAPSHNVGSVAQTPFFKWLSEAVLKRSFGSLECVYSSASAQVSLEVECCNEEKTYCSIFTVFRWRSPPFLPACGQKEVRS